MEYGKIAIILKPIINIFSKINRDLLFQLFWYKFYSACDV